ncbi:putative glycoside hydrolase [Rheinheimera pacifica]|nr:putative glycoside hydrolase [Rheinheimera pacifica]
MLAQLSEVTRAAPKQHSGEQLPLFVRNLADGLAWALSDSTTGQKTVNTSSAVSGDGKSLSMQSVNLAYQEDGRKFVWQTEGGNASTSATASLKYTAPQPLSALADSKFMQMSIRLDQTPSADVSIALMCQQSSCLRSESLLPLLSGLSRGQWHTIALPLYCEGARAPQVAEDAMRLSTTQPFSLALADIALVTAVTEATQVLDCAQ